MVERVAREMWHQNALNIPEGGPLMLPWEDETEALRSDWLALARAAIEAMREPTDRMIDAARIADIGPLMDFDEGCTREWQAMIDAALAPQPAAASGGE